MKSPSVVAVPIFHLHVFEMSGTIYGPDVPLLMKPAVSQQWRICTNATRWR